MSRRLAILLLLASVPPLALAVGQGDRASPPPPTSVIDPELGVPLGGTLLSVPANVPPAMDGFVEAMWAGAPVLAAPMRYGLHGDEPAGVVEFRSLYDDERVYFLARWPAATPGGTPDGAPAERSYRNLFTVHWRLVDPGLVSGESTGSEGLACTVACHTATADGLGGLVGLRSETIPPGLDDDLPTGGGWARGAWTVEWSRPRVSPSPYDQHMTDSAQGYRFFVKLFQGLEGRADPVSDLHELRLSR